MKINTSSPKLDSSIRDAQHGCSARLLTSEQIRHTVTKIEKHLKSLLPKKDWKGLSFSVDVNAQSFPSAYNAIPRSTHFDCVRGSTGWFVTEITRAITKGPTQIITPLNLASKSAEIQSFLNKSATWSK